MNKEFTVIDLTHALSDAVPTWDGSCGFELSLDSDYEDCVPPDVFRTQKIRCGAGIGTHMDAPAHAVPEGKTIDDIAPEELVTGCVVIDVSPGITDDYIVTPSDVEKFEKRNGRIPERSFVIFYTGWDRHWGDREKYHNDHVFPSVHVSAAEMLLERNIAGLGIDTLSADTGVNGFPVHRAVLGAGKYLVENIANAGKLPQTGAKALVLPMKIQGGTEAPVRLFAII